MSRPGLARTIFQVDEDCRNGRSSCASTLIPPRPFVADPPWPVSQDDSLLPRLDEEILRLIFHNKVDRALGRSSVSVPFCEVRLVGWSIFAFGAGSTLERVTIPRPAPVRVT